MRLILSLILQLAAGWLCWIAAPITLILAGILSLASLLIVYGARKRLVFSTESR